MTKQEQKDKAYAEYRAIEGLAYKKYQSIEEPAYKKYQSIEEPAFKEFKAIEEPAYKEYQAIEKQAFKEYQSKCNEIDELDIKIIDGWNDVSYMIIRNKALEMMNKSVKEVTKFVEEISKQGDNAKFINTLIALEIKKFTNNNK